MAARQPGRVSGMEQSEFAAGTDIEPLTVYRRDLRRVAVRYGVFGAILCLAAAFIDLSRLLKNGSPI